jgi:hypothetical protein
MIESFLLSCGQGWLSCAQGWVRADASCPARYFCVCQIFMMPREKKSMHKKRGRPAGRRYRQTIPVRLADETLAEIDAWIDRQRETMSRTEVIRRFIESGLKRKT